MLCVSETHAAFFWFLIQDGWSDKKPWQDISEMKSNVSLLFLFVTMLLLYTGAILFLKRENNSNFFS